MHILITGGARFIGSHLADDLLRRGHRVRTLDNLAPQVHGTGWRPRTQISDGVAKLASWLMDSGSVAPEVVGARAAS